MTQTTRKRGQLGLDEQQFIRDNIGEMSVEAIATSLKRTVKPIERYIVEQKLSFDPIENQTDQNLKLKLHAKTFWTEIQNQFDQESGELQYFENTWVGLVKQFREDVLPAEELQIKQFITIDILINRSMKERKRHILETEKLQKKVDIEYELPEDARDIAKLANLETQLAFARNSISSYTNEYTKLLNEQQKISKDLKATREQRIKRIEDGKSSWVGLIRMLDDELIREKEGKEMQILAMATDKARQKLYENHQYQDDKVDNPILSPETHEFLDKLDEPTPAPEPEPETPIIKPTTTLPHKEERPPSKLQQKLMAKQKPKTTENPPASAPPPPPPPPPPPEPEPVPEPEPPKKKAKKVAKKAAKKAAKKTAKKRAKKATKKPEELPVKKKRGRPRKNEQ